MQARMTNIASLVSRRHEGLCTPCRCQGEKGGVPKRDDRAHPTAARARSMACGVCVDMHYSRDPQESRRKPTSALFSVVAWRESPYFTDRRARRAGRFRREAASRLSDRPDAVAGRGLERGPPGTTTSKGSRSLLIALRQPSHAWNLFNATTRQVGRPVGAVMARRIDPATQDRDGRSFSNELRSP